MIVFEWDFESFTKLICLIMMINLGTKQIRFSHWTIHSTVLLKKNKKKKKHLTVFMSKILNHSLNWFGQQCLLLCSVICKTVDCSYEWDTESFTQSICYTMLIQSWEKQIDYLWVRYRIIHSINSFNNGDSFRNKTNMIYL